MKVDVDMNLDSDSFIITFNIKNLKADKDYEVAHELVSCICGDYNIDPELSIEDIVGLVHDTKESGAEEFTFEISEEGLEAEIIAKK
ncbi:MAG: hypothetical protein A2504_16810 [Bdellovibrionales bacterium RIFOXYD12_FULL_39_22]|nr:MAG: hypothetical protein A2385_14665 [Bdellovibrionales bacterium RIFOXYB1_FULL_39_21]OFZ45032.1 MAG: hypothetical protein A2485_14090 [Bdellovibrionales bacterium RIFOXYC12_FULL_39_17]OFZ49470.1 MAG: hypothetical protein A2404_08575 [Bdellovibrionales bacterium RIFOXYC1_FULL_39_130]OFZ72866.1 MAG: hypothetical protein A2451_15615 [Bdellovibrionales bacterium RIFOXYC2_FULL_39_8]OFZ77209.1 MAG: hypothetical protein A2560_08100 [Bdellovibrionales bacterium RIFOXYD1_FULL_39_84]OFZ95654.1 MAG: